MENHFKYEGNVKVESEKPIFGEMGSWTIYKTGQFPPDAEVNDIQFMTPARVSFSVEGQPEQETIVFIDLMRKKAFNAMGEIEAEFATKLFECLSVSTTMPEDMYEADDETYRKIDEAQARHDEIYGQQQKGDLNE